VSLSKEIFPTVPFSGDGACSCAGAGSWKQAAGDSAPGTGERGAKGSAGPLPKLASGLYAQTKARTVLGTPSVLVPVGWSRRTEKLYA
jgi:hypothetical protein